MEEQAYLDWCDELAEDVEQDIIDHERRGLAQCDLCHHYCDPADTRVEPIFGDVICADCDCEARS